MIVAPWMLGSVRSTAQIILFALSVLAFVTLFIPAGEVGYSVRANLKRLIRFPIFWMGLLFLIYLLIQALNPYAQVKHWNEEGWDISASKWWLTPLQNIKWLPGGVSAPFDKLNTWRALMNWTTPMLLVWTLWAGLQRRRSFVILFWVICVNGALLALICTLMRLNANNEVLAGFTFWESNGTYLGPFLYRNHGAAYLYPSLALCGGMFLYHMLRARRRMQKSNPSILFLCMGILIASAIVFSMSRAGLVISGLVVLFFILLFLISLFRQGSIMSAGVGLVSFVVLGSGAGYATYKAIDTELLYADMKELVTNKSRVWTRGTSLNHRLMMIQATYDLFEERPIQGWGANSFRWTFRRMVLKKEYEPLWYPDVKRRYKAVYIHAHSDWLQFLSELGIVGMILLTAMPLFWFGAFCYYYRAISYEHLMIMSGCVLALLQAAMEFNLSNQAVLILVSVLMAGTVAWMRLSPALQTRAKSA